MADICDEAPRSENKSDDESPKHNDFAHQLPTEVKTVSTKLDG